MICLSVSLSIYILSLHCPSIVFLFFFVSFQMLDSGENEHPVTVAVTATNKPLNRFANITVCKLYMK